VERLHSNYVMMSHVPRSALCHKQAVSRYMRESKVLHIKTVSNPTYAEACNQIQATAFVAPPNVSSEREFPPLPQLSNPGTQPQADRASRPCSQARSDNHETIITEQVNNPNVHFGNPVYLLEFLAEVIRQTIAAKDCNETVDGFTVKL